MIIKLTCSWGSKIKAITITPSVVANSAQTRHCSEVVCPLLLQDSQALHQVAIMLLDWTGRKDAIQLAVAKTSEAREWKK